MENQAEIDIPIHSLLQRRWSPRAFGDRLIPHQVLIRLFEAARWSPSWRNGQPWRFLIATRDNKDEFERLGACLSPGNRRWAINAALLVVIVAKRQYDHHEEPNPMTRYDTGQAMAYLTVEAMANDLYVHQMAGIDRNGIRETYQIDADSEPLVAAAIGYLGSIEDLPEDLQLKEHRQRARKPLNDIVFNDMWGNPANLI